jgi:hypothetical protein
LLRSCLSPAELRAYSKLRATDAPVVLKTKPRKRRK